MALLDIVHMAADQDLVGRITAAAARLGVQAPESWAQLNRWEVLAAPGWDTAWAAAGDQTGITDDMILNVVQSLTPDTQEAAT